MARTAAKQGPAPAKKTAVKTPPAKKAPAPAASTPTTTTPTTTTPAKRTPAKGTPAKGTPARKAVAPAASPPAAGAAPRQSPETTLAVKPGEDPWTVEELAEVRGELDTDRERLRKELNLAEHELHDLMRDAGDGAGNDQADVGSTTFERDHEMSLANNARDMLAQTERALVRIEDSSYGVCESCGEPIGKMRVMAFPRATLCLSCKQREERR